MTVIDHGAPALIFHGRYTTTDLISRNRFEWTAEDLKVMKDFMASTGIESGALKSAKHSEEIFKALGFQEHRNSCNKNGMAIWDLVMPKIQSKLSALLAADKKKLDLQLEGKTATTTPATRDFQRPCESSPTESKNLQSGNSMSVIVYPSCSGRVIHEHVKNLAQKSTVKVEPDAEHVCNHGYDFTSPTGSTAANLKVHQTWPEDANRSQSKNMELPRQLQTLQQENAYRIPQQINGETDEIDSRRRPMRMSSAIGELALHESNYAKAAKYNKAPASVTPVRIEHASHIFLERTADGHDDDRSSSTDSTAANLKMHQASLEDALRMKMMNDELLRQLQDLRQQKTHRSDQQTSNHVEAADFGKLMSENTPAARGNTSHGFHDRYNTRGLERQPEDIAKAPATRQLRQPGLSYSMYASTPPPSPTITTTKAPRPKQHKTDYLPEKERGPAMTKTGAKGSFYGAVKQAHKWIDQVQKDAGGSGGGRGLIPEFDDRVEDVIEALREVHRMRMEIVIG